MTANLEIACHWERLDEGPDEERVSFGLLKISLGDLLFTEGQDGFIECLRPGPLVSGYHLAEWMAWNWWRLTREPRPDAPGADWYPAHCLGTVGAGYLWPNITIYSDRERTALIARPTRPQGFSAFRYTASEAAMIPTRDFEAALDAFVGQVIGKLRAAGLAQTNLEHIWREVQEERADPQVAIQRELEAALGLEPDEGDAGQVQQLLSDAASLGRDAVIELSAGHQPGRKLPTAAELASLAARLGSATRPADMAQITGLDLGQKAKTPAWQQGYQAARALRAQAGLAQQPLADKRLAELCAVSPTVLKSAEPAPLAFGLDEAPQASGRIVLRSGYTTGRRFDLARLLGDRITSGLDERLLPATRARTFRQKRQRAFAAELLCPFDALTAVLSGDYSDQACEDAAQHFQVSPQTLRTLLVNHGFLDRDTLDGDPDALGEAA